MKYFAKALLLLMIVCLMCSCSVTPVSPDPQVPSAPTDDPAPVDPDLPVTMADNVLLDPNATANRELLPRGIDKTHTWVKTVSGNELTVYYPTTEDSFSYAPSKGVMGESAWLSALRDEYDIRIHAVRKSPASALSAQRLALMSGMSLDLMAFTPAQLPYALNMTSDASELLNKNGNASDFLNPTLATFGGKGKRFFTPVGVARNLWYLTDTHDENEPQALAKSKHWDLAAFTNFIASATKKENGKITVYGMEAQDFTDFLHAAGTPVIGFDKSFTNGTAAAKNNVKRLQNILLGEGRYYNGKSTDKNAPAMAKGTLAMRYGQTPFIGVHKKYPTFCWAPLPADRSGEEGILSACAPVFALPKNGSKNEIALLAALIWTARAADANHDLMRFTYGMSFEQWEAYHDATIRQIAVIPALDEQDKETLTASITSVGWNENKYIAFADSVAANVRLNNEKL